MRKIGLLFTVLFILCFASACGNKADNTSAADENAQQKDGSIVLIVSAAASLTDVMTEIGDNYSKTHPNVKVKFNFGASGTLMQQILEGAPADIFFSAAEDKFTKLVDEGMIDKKNSADLLSNSLVLITAKDNQSIKDFNDLQRNTVDKFAIGTPEIVPVGKYARQALKAMNLWKKVEPKSILTKDVRQVLQYVETGNTEAGIVYKTDAAVSNKVKIIAEAPADTHDAITYPAGIVKDTKHAKTAADFYQYLQDDDTLKVFEKYGFTVK